jgi:hypothetical protein
MTLSDPEKLMLDTLNAFRDVFGPFELKVTTDRFTAATPGYPKVEPQVECSSQTWDRHAKHPLHDRIMAWRAKR